MRNSFVISKKKIPDLNNENYKYVCLNQFHIYVWKYLSMLKTDSFIFIGYGVDTSQGKKIDLSILSNLKERKYSQKTKYFAGRFIIVFASGWLYTDSTSSFSIYYNKDLVGNNLNLLHNLKSGKRITSHNKKRDNLIIPPKTHISEFKRLIPGQKLDLINFEPVTITDLFEYQDFTIQELTSKIKKNLVNTAKGIENLAKNDYLHMLTGGRDSRISLLAFQKNINNSYDSFTHLKFKRLLNINDKFIVKKIVKKYELNHFFTFPEINFNFQNIEQQIEETNPFISRISQEGSTWFYYRFGNMFKLNKTYLIDNYYEIGRMHFHKNVKSSNLKEYLINKLNDTSHTEIILKYIDNLSTKFDPIDLYYYIKNYVNVANQFELIDYSHNPMIFNNSAILMNLMLSVPKEMRINGKLHDQIIKDMSGKNYIKPNFISNNIIYRGFNKFRKKISKG